MIVSKRNYTLEFWRFVFAISICAFHFELKYVEIFGVENTFFASGYMGVEFFFIFSGFFIAQWRDKIKLDVPVAEAGNAALLFVKKKFKLLWPKFAVVVLFLLVFIESHSVSQLAKNIMNLEWDLTFLQNFSVGRQQTLLPPMWYVSSLIITGYFLVFFISWKKYFTLYILAPIACLLGYSFYGFRTTVLISNAELFGFLSSGTIRGFAGLALGIITYQIYLKVVQIKMTKFRLILFNFLELYAIYRTVTLIFMHPADINNFRLLFYFPIIIIISFMNVTVLAKILNNKISKYLGSISLNVYLIHYGIQLAFLGIVKAPNGRIVDLPLFICVTILLAIIMEAAVKCVPALYSLLKKVTRKPMV